MSSYYPFSILPSAFAPGCLYGAYTIIIGPGANQLLISAPNNPVLTNATAGIAYISGLSLTGAGAIIQNYGSLTLDECVVANAHSAPPTWTTPRGIANSGTMSLTNCTLTNNSSYHDAGGGGAGGGIYNAGKLTVASCTIAGNSGGGSALRVCSWETMYVLNRPRFAREVQGRFASAFVSVNHGAT